MGMAPVAWVGSRCSKEDSGGALWSSFVRDEASTSYMVP